MKSTLKSDEVTSKTCTIMYRAENQIYFAWDGEYQENLFEFSGWHLHPYILSYMYVYVCTRSINMYHISLYPKSMGVRVSHSGD